MGTLIRQAMAVNALGVSMRSSSKSLWRSVLSCSSDQTLRSILLSIWIHVFHPRVPRCLVKQDDSNNFTEVEDPFYEQEGDSLGAERLTLNSSFDCTLQVETVRSLLGKNNCMSCEISFLFCAIILILNTFPPSLFVTHK